MLSYLSIQNVSVIESVSFELNKRLNTLTGETGSGKSVMVGALKLILGDRFQRTMLREGADKLIVEAIFDDVSHISDELKEAYSIEDELTIRREVDDLGKNRVFINGRVAAVGLLKEFAPYLVDIHGQHEHQALLDETKHIEFIDHLVPNEFKERYAVAYNKYREVKTARQQVLDNINEVRKHQDIVEFQLAEINRAEIVLEDDLELTERVAFLSHIENIRNACNISLDAVSDGEFNAIALISKSIKSLEPLSEVSLEISAILDSLSLAVDNLDSASKSLSSMIETQEASPEELDRLVQRKYVLQDLIKKYGGTLENVIATKQELENKLNNFQGSDEILKKLEIDENNSLQYAQQAADALNGERKKVSDRISAHVMEILAELELPHSRFLTVYANKPQLDSSGGMEVKFYISVNKGFEPAPMAQVASGGEISRVMLALKEVFSESDPVSTLIFDEIDTGISGVTAKKVAEKLKRLSEKKQIVVITHLPVVAAKGDAHYYIQKGVENDKTRTTIRLLEDLERKRVLAAMIAGDVTGAALQQAQELLSNG